jgi:hypothetical protein
MKTGLELELWIVDDEGRLRDCPGFADGHDRIEREFVGPLVEVKTAPHDSEDALGRDLQRTLRTAIHEAGSHDRQLVPLGTPLTATAEPARTERGELFEEIYGEGVASAKNCAGTHIHFEKGDVRRQLNLLTALDPALALLSSSPYYRGRRTVNCARALAYRTDCGEAFERYCDLLSYVDSVEEWRARVDDGFREFKSLAAERGVPTDDVAERFEPETTVLNPVRLRRSQPTVEWRAPDSALPSQVLRLASDVRTLVAEAETKPLDFGTPGVAFDRIGVPEFSTLEELSREAIRWGLNSGPVRDYLWSMGFDARAYRPITAQLGGPGRIAESEARKIRLEYAERLRADVETLDVTRPSDGVGTTGDPYVHT